MSGKKVQKKNRIKYERNKYSCKKNSLEIFIWDIYIVKKLILLKKNF